MELKESFFDGAEVRLHVMEGPDAGPPLVLVHGSTGSWMDWLPVLPQLMEHWHVYAPDLRGHGQSGRAADIAGYHISKNVEDTAVFLREVVGSPAVLFGHSWGGVTALLTGGPAREYISAIVAEDPPLMLRRETQLVKPYMDYFAWAYRMKQSASTVEEVLAVLQRDNPGAPAEALMPWAENLANVDPVYLQTLLNGREPVEGIDFEAAIEAIECPILLLQADPARQGAMEAVDVDLVRQHARQLEYAFFEGAGHGIHNERTAEVLEVLDRFIANWVKA